MNRSITMRIQALTAPRETWTWLFINYHKENRHGRITQNISLLLQRARIKRTYKRFIKQRNEIQEVWQQVWWDGSNHQFGTPCRDDGRARKRGRSYEYKLLPQPVEGRDNRWWEGGQIADPDAMFLCLALACESSASISQKISFISTLRNVIRSDQNQTCHLIASLSELTFWSSLYRLITGT